MSSYILSAKFVTFTEASYLRVPFRTSLVALCAQRIFQRNLKQAADLFQLGNSG
jgi:hypothetical protein